MGVKFINVTGEENTRTFYVKSDKEEIRFSSNTNNVITKLFNKFLNNYQKEEQILRNGKNYIFDIYLKLYHFHEIDLKRGSSYINSPKWVKTKGVTINPIKTKDNRCLQYVVAVALNHKNIRNHPERISNIKPFINNFNWKDINFPAGIKDWEIFERNNRNIALNILSASPNEKKISYTNQIIIVNAKIK